VEWARSRRNASTWRSHLIKTIDTDVHFRLAQGLPRRTPTARLRHREWETCRQIAAERCSQPAGLNVSGESQAEQMSPVAPKHPCRYPGCAALINAGDSRCARHQVKVQRELDQLRGSSASRGYGSKWRTVSKEFLRLNPLCVDCRMRGIPKVATVVDHIIPHKGDACDEDGGKT
jgi:5-methylcytosine-specific restriction enzyme A